MPESVQFVTANRHKGIRVDSGLPPSSRVAKCLHGPPCTAVVAPCMKTEVIDRWTREHRLGLFPVVPPLSTRIGSWEHDREIYRRRNQVERRFAVSNGFRRTSCKFKKLDMICLPFLSFVLVANGLFGLC